MVHYSKASCGILVFFLNTKYVITVITNVIHLLGSKWLGSEDDCSLNLVCLRSLRIRATSPNLAFDFSRHGVPAQKQL